jgi:branched-chain amino acid transport system ATP-binding protein
LITARRKPRAGAENTEIVLQAQGLSAGYNRVPVIHDVDLKVRQGEVVAVLGANGAGKTTTVLALAGELSALGGTVELSGGIVTTPLFSRARAGLRLVTEGRSVFMGMTTHDNLRLAHKDIRPCLDLFPELEPILGRKAGLLSGGEQQMLTLARALAGDPRVLLIDELSLGLAPIVVQRLLVAIRAAADRGVGVVLVEQQMQNALAVADWGCVMRRGRVVHQGPAKELLSNTSQIEALYLGGA